MENQGDKILTKKKSYKKLMKQILCDKNTEFIQVNKENKITNTVLGGGTFKKIDKI